MKKLIMTLTLLISVSSFASTDCDEGVKQLSNLAQMRAQYDRQCAKEIDFVSKYSELLGEAKALQDETNTKELQINLDKAITSSKSTCIDSKNKLEKAIRELSNALVIICSK